MTEEGAHLRRAADAEAHKVATEWGSLKWLAGSAAGNAQGLTLGHVVIRKGKSNPRHRHNGCEEVLYLLRGRLEHTVGAGRVLMEPGDTLVMAPGVFHNAVNVGDCDAEMIVAYSSAERDVEGE